LQSFICKAVSTRKARKSKIHTKYWSIMAWNWELAKCSYLRGVL